MAAQQKGEGSKVKAWMIAVALLAAPVAALAGEQKVFKCVSPNGSVTFSPQPCGSNAREVKVGVTPRGQTSSDRAVAKTTQYNAVQAISDSVANSRCRDDARKLYQEPDVSTILRAETEIREIQGRAWYGDSALALQLASEDATRVVALRNLISSERARVDEARAESQRRMDAALARCDELKQQRENGGG